MNNLKILNLATHDYGGAGTASVYINDLLNAIGFYSKMVVWDKKVDSPYIIKCKLHSKNFISAKLYRKWNRKEGKRWDRIKTTYGFTNKTVFDPQRSYASAKSIITQVGFTPDLIILHWVSFFMTPHIINDLRKITGAKIAWLMLDNSPITGGCHYPFKCDGYQSNCQHCPLFRIQNTIPQENLASKLQWIPEDLEFWGTSFDVHRANKSAVGQTRIARSLLFPINESLITNEPKEKIRTTWGLPQNKKLILIGCSDMNDIRKGGEYLLSALILLKERYPLLYSDLSLVLVGDNQSNIYKNIGYELYTLGRLPISDLMQIYKAVDFFLSTSIEDSGPLMINQSIASGTPVVSFNIGVAQDLISNKHTGYTAELEDIEDLLLCMVKMLTDLEEKPEDIQFQCKEIYSKKKQELSICSCINAIMSK